MEPLNSKRRRPGREALLLIYFPVYLFLFWLVEQLITDHYWVSYCALDARIPFVPEFVFAYVTWYPLMLGMTCYLLYHDRRAFLRYGWTVIVGFTASIIIFFIFPSGQELRPAEVPGSGLAQTLVRLIYAADTNTNVMPSMHVVGTLAAMAAAFDTPTIPKPVRWGIVALGLVINASTVLIKQHSLLDILGGIALFALVYLLVDVLPEKIRRHKRK